MKRLIDSRYEYTDEGLKIYKKFKDLINKEFLNEVKKGVDPQDLFVILTEVADNSYTLGINYINNYFSSKGYETDKLEIKHNVTSELKYAEFSGYDNKGHRFWKYEEGYTPTSPFGLKSTGQDVEWYLLVSSEDKEFI